MSESNCELHHTAYRVPDIEQSINDWCARLGARVELPPTLVSADQVLVAFLLFAGGRIELVQSLTNPGKTGKPGRPDHICLLCTDFDARVARAADEGAVIARAPVPSEAFGTRRMCFVVYGGVGLIEFVEK